MEVYEKWSLRFLEMMDRWTVKEVIEELVTLDMFEINLNVDINEASN